MSGFSNAKQFSGYPDKVLKVINIKYNWKYVIPEYGSVFIVE